MSLTASLTASLQNFAVQQPSQWHTHTLYLECPAPHLIDRSTGLHARWQAPVHASYRDKPDQKRFFLREFGLDFFVRFPVPKSSAFTTTVDTGVPLIDQIRGLVQHGGESTLQLMTVTDKCSQSQGYLLRLLSEHGIVWKGCLSQGEWHELLAVREARAWTSLLEDLIYKRSDRAWLHVNQRLAITKAHSIEAMRWGSGLPESANDTLALNLRQVIDTPSMLRLEPIRYLHPERKKPLQVRLPCEHEMHISEHAILALSAQECLNAQCPTCHVAIFPNRDIIKYQCHLERRRRERKRCDELLSTRIERETKTSCRLSISAPMLGKAFRHALRSMQVPQSASPGSLSPAKSAEATAVFRRISALWDSSIGKSEGSMDEVHELLSNEAQRALQELYGCSSREPAICTLPGWSPFLARWLERTVKLAGRDNYQGEDEWEVYGEPMDEDIVIEDDADVDDLEGLLENVVV